MDGTFQHIQFRVEDRVGRVTFARPPLNIFDIAMMRDIDRALTSCMERRDMVAVVFDAAPGSRAFSAGVAIEEQSRDDSPDARRVQNFMTPNGWRNRARAFGRRGSRRGV